MERTKGMAGKRMDTQKLTAIGMLAAVSAVLMVLEIPLWFMPPFYKLDISEVPVLIGAFTFGPVAGVMTELIKILIKLVVKGSETAFVGEAANFLVGISLVLPAAIIYKRKPTKKRALSGMAVGVICMTVLGSLVNAFILLPFYAKAFHMPLDQIITLGSQVNGAVSDFKTFVAFGVAPFNLLKGVVVSAITYMLYKRVSRYLKK